MIAFYGCSKLYIQDPDSKETGVPTTRGKKQNKREYFNGLDCNPLFTPWMDFIALI